MNIEKHHAFIDSLEGEKGLPEEMHGWRFEEPLNELSHAQPGDAWRFRDYMIERCRRAESRQIPDLKKRVKELVRDAMDIANDYACDYETNREETVAAVVPDFMRTRGNRMTTETSLGLAGLIACLGLYYVAAWLHSRHRTKMENAEHGPRSLGEALDNFANRGEGLGNLARRAILPDEKTERKNDESKTG